MTTIEQVGNAITRLNTKKALVDGIPVAAIKEATQMFPGNPNVDLRFKKEYFPSIWKEERLVFISKGGEHRLSIVLFTSSQTEVRELVIKAKLQDEFERKFLASNRVEFREGLSTIQAMR